MSQGIRYYALLIVCVFASFGANAQQFSSALLQTIYEKLPATSSDSLRVKGFEVGVERTNKGVISELGVRIPIMSGDSTLVGNFIRRTLLDIITAEKGRDLMNVLDRNKCKLYLNDAEYQEGPFWELERGVAIATDCSSFDLRRDSLAYSVFWGRENGDKLKMTFPANIQILTGMDKVEMELALADILFAPYPAVQDEVVQDSALYTKQGSLYVKEDKSFLIEDMTNTTYYSKRWLTGHFDLVYSPDYVAETLMNLFLVSSEYGASTNLYLQHNVYGNKTLEYELTLDDFLAYCRANNFELYAGAEEVTKEEIKATVIAYSKEANFIHLLYVSTDIGAIFSTQKRVISAYLYTYISYDNVANLFDKN